MMKYQIPLTIYQDMSTAISTATFQPLLGDIKDYLDWNRWMILGLTLWALLVAIVIGSSSSSATQFVTCAGQNVTATTLECTCEYPFPGVVWVAGLVIMGGVVAMETFTDCVHVDRTKRKGVYPREKSVSELMAGVDDVASVEAVPPVLHVCQAAREGMTHAGIQALPQGMTRDELYELVNSISTTLATPEFKKEVEEKTKSEATYAKFSIVALLKPGNVVDIGVPSITQTAVLAALHYVQDFIATAVTGAVEGGRGGGGGDTDKPKVGAEKASLGGKGRVPTTPAAAALAKAMTDVIPDDKVMSKVQTTVQAAVIARVSITVSDMVNVGRFTIFYRAFTNFLIFYTIIALTSYNWFPIGKGCFVSWPSETHKAFTLLGIGFLSVILIGIRTTVFDLVDISVKSTTIMK
eukprot:Phypoly_transcript_08057.p1 GENE.Phypoly_transcript_08057~~Phypoly_transcript_08057.p1  ORF type:complete len:409 (+),score=64.79 Phypoly_transcript_08057:104-1330(+)